MQWQNSLTTICKAYPLEINFPSSEFHPSNKVFYSVICLRGWFSVQRWQIKKVFNLGTYWWFGGFMKLINSTITSRRGCWGVNLPQMAPWKKHSWTKKIIFHEPKKIVPRECNQFYFYFFWLADHPKKKKKKKKSEFETLHAPQIEVWRCFPLGHLCKLWKLNFGPRQWDKVWWLLGTSWGTHWELGKLLRNHWAPVKTHWAHDGNMLFYP